MKKDIAKKKKKKKKLPAQLVKHLTCTPYIISHLNKKNVQIWEC